MSIYNQVILNEVYVLKFTEDAVSFQSNLVQLYLFYVEKGSLEKN